MSSTPSSMLRRAGLVAALAATGVLTAAGVAAAHVTVHPDSYAKGATDGVLSFRVPDEDDSASTTEVQLFLPTDHPLLGVLVSPHDGWTAKVTNTKLRTPVKTDDGTIADAVSEITWTGGKIGPGHYEDFDVAFGQLPDNTAELTFKALQTYSNGKVVRWIETGDQSGDEPENPAPVLKLTASDSGSAGASKASASGSASTSGSTSSSAAGSNSASAAASANDSTARGLGVAGLVVGVLGLAAAVFAVRRGRPTGGRPE